MENKNYITSLFSNIWTWIILAISFIVGIIIYKKSENKINIIVNQTIENFGQTSQKMVDLYNKYDIDNGRLVLRPNELKNNLNISIVDTNQAVDKILNNKSTFAFVNKKNITDEMIAKGLQIYSIPSLNITMHYSNNINNNNNNIDNDQPLKIGAVQENKAIIESLNSEFITNNNIVYYDTKEELVAALLELNGVIKMNDNDLKMSLEDHAKSSFNNVEVLYETAIIYKDEKILIYLQTAMNDYEKYMQAAKEAAQKIENTSVPTTNKKTPNRFANQKEKLSALRNKMTTMESKINRLKNKNSTSKKTK